MRKERWRSGHPVTRIVARAYVVDPEWSDPRHLSHVLAGLRPVEVRRVPGQHDNRPWRIRLQLRRVEAITETDVEDPGDYRVHPVFPMAVRHELHALRDPHSDGIQRLLRGLANNDGQAG